MNPYKELGVSENATQDEIRAAYLKMVKQYHPDRYTDSPLKEMAGEKLTRINLAYETLTKKKNDPSGFSYSSGSASSYGSPRYGQYSSGRSGSQTFSQARSYISQNNLDAAKSFLDRVQDHNAEWHYLYGIIYLRQGWYERAKEYLSRACAMDPSNIEYARARASIMNSYRSGQVDTNTVPHTPTVVCCGPLLTVLLCDLCTPCC